MRSLLNAWLLKKTIPKLERNSKHKQRPIENSSLNVQQDTDFQPQARRQSEAFSHPLHSGIILTDVASRKS
jgi:hypothetical protein